MSRTANAAMRRNLTIDVDRLIGRIEALARVGAIPGGGAARLALTDDDKASRDLVVAWMREAGLAIGVDAVGNVVGLRPGDEDLAPVMIGSHIDTVKTGGRYDGNLGVLAGLEVCRVLDDAGLRTRRPLAVAFFTNEEGARFAPDMLGSLVYVGGMNVDEALATRAIDGAVFGEELARIGYRGDRPPGFIKPHAYLELHIEQGPILEAEGLTIGAVTGVQGISWTEWTLGGVSNHAGTTPMRLRHDAGYVAARIAGRVREIAAEIGDDQVGTVGRIELTPNLVNVIAAKAVMTVDLRNTDEDKLRRAEGMAATFIDEIATAEGVSVARRSLARFEPVAFAPEIVDLVERAAKALGHSVRRMPSGAGHDAQMLARICPTGMIFVPSAKGLSHNVGEFTAPADIAAGANVLLQSALELAA
ncbi:MAG: Zn-dependent hydrolase [Alphaproteobacteria bacterium]|nr:Zn-dependent hydrolase [Alphaproteobacteria bacterium]